MHVCSKSGVRCVCYEEMKVGGEQGVDEVRVKLCMCML